LPLTLAVRKPIARATVLSPAPVWTVDGQVNIIADIM